MHLTEDDQPDAGTWVPDPEALVADLAAMLRTGATVERCRGASALLELELVRAKAATGSSSDLAVSAHNLIREACAAVDGMQTGAIGILLAVAPGWRGRLLKDRRRAAAERLNYSVEHVRKDREPLMIEALADELYAMDSVYRLRHRRRTDAELNLRASSPRIDWLAQHRSYRRIWTPVTALRNDLIVLIHMLQEVREQGRIPRPHPQLDDGSADKAVDADMWADLSDRCANLTWRLAQYGRELDLFIEREGGLWLLADAHSEVLAADAMYRLGRYLPFGEADESWARTLLADTPHQELDGYIDRLIASGKHWAEFKTQWIDWAQDFLLDDAGAPIDRASALIPLRDPGDAPASFRTVAPAAPKTDCGRWLDAGEDFIALIDEDWWRIADWYRAGAEEVRADLA